MTRKEAVNFLESYKYQKELEKSRILTIKELEENAQTAKSIDMTSERVQGGKSVLPEYIYAKIMDLKEALVREVYSNTIRLSILEEYIYRVAKEYDNAIYANILYYRFIMNYSFSKIERETNYSIVRLKQLFKEALECIYKILEPLSLDSIEQEIKDKSYISRDELDEYYKKVYSLN